MKRESKDSIKFLSDPGGFKSHLDLNISLTNLFAAVSKIK